MQTEQQQQSEQEWVACDRDVTAHARNRAMADYEEGRLLLRVKRSEVWKHFAMSSLQAYVHWKLGYDFHTTNEKIRVAEELEKCPKLAKALMDGDVHWSKVREVSRIIVDETADEWIDAMKKMTAREVERKCATLQRGDRPTTQGDPSRIRNVMRFEANAEEYAVTIGVLGAINKANGGKLTQSQCLALAMQLAAAGLEKPPEVPQAAYQVNMSKCPDCGRGFVEAGGETIEVRRDVIERAECDAVIIETKEATPACRTVPPKVDRAAKARAHHRCESPTCRNHLWIQTHHRTLRSEGGGHELENLVGLCWTCHDLVHEGLLLIEGTRATGLVFKLADGTELGRLDAEPERIDMFERAYGELRANGIGETEAKRVLRELRQNPEAVTIEDLVRLGLERAARSYKSHVGPDDDTSVRETAVAYC